MATSQGRQHQKPPPPKVGRGVKQTLPRASRRSHPCPHRDSSLPALRTEREDIPATSLSHQACSALVVAALGNEHTYPPIFSFIFFCSLAIAFYKWKVNPQSGKKKKKEQNRHAAPLSFIRYCDLENPHHSKPQLTHVSLSMASPRECVCFLHNGKSSVEFFLHMVANPSISIRPPFHNGLCSLTKPCAISSFFL